MTCHFWPKFSFADLAKEAPAHAGEVPTHARGAAEMLEQRLSHPGEAVELPYQSNNWTLPDQSKN